MNIALICSKKDPASMNMRHGFAFFEETRESFQNSSVYRHMLQQHTLMLYTLNDDLLSLTSFPNADLLIFFSKHRSKENTPNFTIHAPGNWGNAEFGGRTGTLCQTSSFLLKSLFIEISKTAGLPVTMEPTHHGPYAETPSIFVEIGSSEKEWNNKEFGKQIAESIVRSFKNPVKKYRSALLLGGLHYNDAANNIQKKSDLAIGHICPKYNLHHLNKVLLSQAIEKTIEGIDIILVDWKGMGEEKQRILDLLETMNILYERTQRIATE